MRSCPAWERFGEEGIEEHQRFAAALRERIHPMFDTTEGGPLQPTMS